MNKIYKLIWSKTKNCWVVASELARGHGKNKSRIKNSMLAVFVMSALLAGGVTDVQALTQQEKEEIKNEVARDLLDKIAHGGEIPGVDATRGPTNFPDAIADRIFFYDDISKKIGEKLKNNGLTLRYFGVRPDYIEPGRDYLNRYGDANWTNADNDGAFGAHSMALGYRAFSEAKHGVAIGRSALAGGSKRDGDYGGDGGVAIGNHAWALGDKSVSVGNAARAVHKGIAIGIQAEAGLDEDDNTTDWSTTPGFTPKPGKSIQYDPDTKLPYVTSDLTQKYGAIAIGTDAKARGRHSTAIGTGSKANGHYAWSLGFGSEASAMETIAFGNNAKAKGLGAIAIGSDHESSTGGAQAYSANTIAIGRGAKAGNENDTATEYNSIAIGPNAKAYSGSTDKVQNSTALGAGAYASKSGVTAVGAKAVSVSSNATVVGYNAVAAADNSVVLGVNTRADIADGVALGSESQVNNDYFGGKVGKAGYDPLRQNLDTSVWKSTKAAVSVGDRDKNITRQIINVAAGSEGTDAVNVAQLQGLEQKAWDDLTEVKKDLGARIQTNAGNITKLSNRVGINEGDIGRLKTDVSTNQQEIKYLKDNMPFMHYVSVNEKNTNETTDNRKNDGAKAVGSIAIGVNAHSYGEDAVTLGYNSFSSGQGSVVIGETSRNSTGGFAAKKGQFDQSIVVGSQNEVFAQSAENGGREDTILGSKNNITESHGTFVRGVGNYVANAYNDEVMTADEKKQLEGYLRDTEGAPESPIGLFEKERSHVTVDGDGNAVAGAIYTRVSGVSNEISSSNDKPKSSYNIVTGNRNTLGDSSHNLILGDNHELNDVNGNIIIGSLKTKAKTTKSNVTILGNDANVSVEGGVALGTGSVADTAAEVAGYDPLTGEASTKTEPAWKSGNGAVSVGTADKTRQITNLAAGMADTDAVNVAQLKAIKQKIDKGAIHYFSVNSDDSANPDGTNWKNDGAKGTDAVAIGSSAKAQREFATAVGAKTAAAGKGANAYGGGIAAGEGTVAIGQNAVAALKSGITQEEYDALKNYQKALYISDNKGLYYQYRYQRGKIARDEQNYNVAIGSGAESYANQTLSLGYKAKSDVDGGVAIGAESSANRQAGGIGYIATGSSATFEDALTTLNKKEDYDKWTATVDASKKEYDKLTRNFDIARTNERKAEAKAALDAWKEQHADFVEALAKKEMLEATWKGTKGAVSVGKDEINEAGNRVIASRQITHVAAGTEDTDAVNVAQLKTAKTTVEAGDYVTVTKGTKTGVDGTVYTVTGPTLSIDGGNLTVADDEKDGKKVGYKLSLNKTLTGLESVTSDEFKSGDNVTIDKTGLTITGGPSVTTGGIDAGKKKITNVAAGAADGDAVNFKQLSDVKTQVETNKADIAANKTAIEKNAGDIAANKTAIEKNAGDIAANKTAIEKNAGDIATNKTAIEKNAGDIKDLTTRVDANADNIAANTEKIGKNSDAIAENKAEISKKMTSWNLKAEGVDGEQKIENDGTVTFGVVEKDKGLTVERDGSTIKYGINGEKIDISKNESITGLKKEIEESKVTLEGDDTTGIVVTPEKKEGKSTNYKISLGNKAKVGDIVIDGTKDKGSISGLTEVKVGDDVKLDKTGLTIKDGPSVTKDGINAGNKVITGVADGKKETDAVNVRQLTGVEKKVDINSQNISMIGNKMGELGNRVNRVGAGAAALAALHPLDFDPDDKWDFAAGYGNYKGANAAAVGAYYRPNEDTMISVGGSFGGGENMVNAGVSVKLGQGNHVTTSRVAMAKEIKDLRAEVEVLRQAIVGVGQGQELDSMKMKLFPDIAKNHWAYEAVEELTKQGLLEGYPDGTFGGDRMMTRYEFATLVYRAMQKGLNVNEKLIQEFEPELERFRIDVISKDKNGNPVIERVRVNKKADTAEMANA